jgi:pantothenate synthetase
MPPSSARVRNLSSIVRLSLKLVRLIAGLLASSTVVKLSPAARAAMEALAAALEALLATLPEPGDDNSPGTVA